MVALHYPDMWRRMQVTNKQDTIGDRPCSGNVRQERLYIRTPLLSMYACIVQRVSTWSYRNVIPVGCDPAWGLRASDERAVSYRIRNAVPSSYLAQ
jgi:hypothetical protein